MTTPHADSDADWAFAVVFAPLEAVKGDVEFHLGRWWKQPVGPVSAPSSLRPLHMPKIYNPKVKEVALFAVAAARPAVLLESNLRDGYASLSHMVIQTLQVDSIVLRSFPERLDYSPSQMFEHFDNGDRSTRRAVNATLDERWHFHAFGEERWFEESAYYAKRRVKDRLTRDLIRRYVGRLGVSLEDIERAGPRPPDAYYLQLPRTE